MELLENLRKKKVAALSFSLAAFLAVVLKPSTAAAEEASEVAELRAQYYPGSPGGFHTLVRLVRFQRRQYHSRNRPGPGPDRSKH